MPRDPGKLLDSVSRALDWEECQTDAEKRREVLVVIRRTVDEWMRGRVTTEQAVTMISSMVS